jgi:hypothetical protein
MKLSQIKKIINAKYIVRLKDSDKLEIKMGCGSDLMSDVLAFIKRDSLLLTGLTNPQVIRTAEMADVVAICFVRGKKPFADTIELAKQKGTPLLSTDLPMYESCGRLYKEGLLGCSEMIDDPT